MKKTALALAALFALSGAAFAGSADRAADAPKAQTKIVKIEKKTGENAAQDATAKPRLGMDTSPWFIVGM